MNGANSNNDVSIQKIEHGWSEHGYSEHDLENFQFFNFSFFIFFLVFHFFLIEEQCMYISHYNDSRGKFELKRALTFLGYPEQTFTSKRGEI